MDLDQDEFLNEFENIPDYKPHYEFKSKMQASVRLERISLVPLFKLADEVMRVHIVVGDTLDRCQAEVVGEDHDDVCFPC